jgi:hypothetical protein
MSTVLVGVQLFIAFGIYNVWLLRANRETPWRGGSAKTMEQEFHVYGLSTTFMKIVGVVKVSMATLLVIGIWYPPATQMGAIIMAALMSAAVVMHCKVKDPVKKSLPAASLLLLSLVVAFATPL